jgi:hypothetical protein
MGLLTLFIFVTGFFSLFPKTSVLPSTIPATLAAVVVFKKSRRFICIF